jgi:hypothetical protein
MSISGEQVFTEDLVKQTMELLGRSLVSVKADIRADRNRLEVLEKEVNSLRSEIKNLGRKSKL